MALHKLMLEDFYDEAYLLIAIHSRIEDYRLAYLLNKNLEISLSRSAKDLDLNYTGSSFSIYEWYDEAQYLRWNLISNTFKTEEESLYNSGTLFKETGKTIKTYHLLSELKKVDYFIKISEEIQNINPKHLINKLQAVPQIITSYSIDINKIKSKEHLIF
jgi:hypothetical protein